MKSVGGWRGGSASGRDVHIGYSPELFEEVSGEKGDDSILRRYDLVGGEDMLLLWPSLWIEVGVRKILVEEDGARSARARMASE